MRERDSEALFALIDKFYGYAIVLSLMVDRIQIELHLHYSLLHDLVECLEFVVIEDFVSDKCEQKNTSECGHNQVAHLDCP